MKAIRTQAILLGGLMMLATAAPAQVPSGYPADYAQTIADAKREGHVTVWSATDRNRVTELIAGFTRAFPGIAVEYLEMETSELNQRFLADRRAGRQSADILWSPAMDLQIKLVNDGYAQSYASPERARIAPWAVWKNQAWGTTAEPIVMAYNRRLIDPAAMPKSHDALEKFLSAHPRALSGKIGTYDPERSGSGFLYLMQDRQATRDLWPLVTGMGALNVRLFSKSEEILRELSAGRLAIGYNVTGSYALDELTRNPDLGVVLPTDYTLVMSRIAMIPTNAHHPAAARLFLDYLLSARGQAALAKRGISSVRGDVPVPAGLRQPGAHLRAIRVGPALMVSQDQLTRRLFLKRWKRALATR